MKGVVVTELKRIRGGAGTVLHALKSTDPEFSGFGEAYFSEAPPGEIKPWRRHRETTCNLVVPVGKADFALWDGVGDVEIESLSPSRYCRLTIKPGIWFAFRGSESGSTLVLNISSQPHDPEESDRAELDDPDFPVIEWPV